MPHASRHPHIVPGIVAALAAAVLGLLGLQAYLAAQPLPPPREVEWGATFSSKMCARLHVDEHLTYEAVVGDLRPSVLRLIAYWDLIEPAEGRYDFRDLDWQVAVAQRAGIPVVLTVGRKVPRWPEYHIPAWLPPDDERFREQRLLRYLAVVVRRYRDRPGLRYWQVENEPYLAFGVGPSPSTRLLEREIRLVHSLDPRHPVLVTDGGEWGGWVRAAALGDVFGTSIYREVYDPHLGTFAYPLTPEFYVLKERYTKLRTGKWAQRFICAELGAEPWGARPVPQLTDRQQVALFPPGSVRSVAEFARRARFTEYYFWGVEWWYRRRQLGDASYWDEGKAVIRYGRGPRQASHSSRRATPSAAIASP